MRASTRITLAALAALLCASAVVAQAGDAWVEVTPEGEGFVARMPMSPAPQAEHVEAGELKVAGRRYAAAGEDNSAYTVWVLDDPLDIVDRSGDKPYMSERLGRVALYLDQIAELAWELLVGPEFERLKNEKVTGFYPGMAYRREFELGGRPAREYSVTLEKARGLVYVCTGNSRIYVVAALGPEAQAAQLKQFVESFHFKGTTPEVAAPSTGPGGGAFKVYGTEPGTGSKTGGGDNRLGGGPAPVEPVDYTRPFHQKDVNRKALITAKPEPGFTESARKFNVTGVVRIMAILNRTGEVTNISVMKGLPHGLTWKALDAVKRVKFEPAQKDGQTVSQHVVFEYNFHIY